MTYSKILGTGSYLPEKVLTNHDIEKMVNTSHDWIVDRTGIEQRHIAADHETAASMAEIAALKAIKAAGIEATEIGLIVLGTATPDRTFPSTACLLQHRLGITEGAAFDVVAACSGFIYAMSVADQYIRAGTNKKVLVVGSEVLSRITDWTDRNSCVLFADGAGAIVLGASEEPGILSTHIHSDGKYADLLSCSNPVNNQAEYLAPYITMKGNEVFRVAVKTLSRIVDETLEANNLQKSDVDWLITHQANIRIIQATAKKLNMPMEQVVVTVNKHGNTSSASIPLALDIAIRDGRVKRGQTIIMGAFGGGFTWGSALIKY
ncbi:MAG: 3-oxoacyl-ACP synthase [Gammaproteobacteria bacterium]|nr:MAG: 3-oxoacyl-ACP synthase [Gammaproteobacteria bacterium]